MKSLGGNVRAWENLRLKEGKEREEKLISECRGMENGKYTGEMGRECIGKSLGTITRDCYCSSLRTPLGLVCKSVW